MSAWQMTLMNLNLISHSNSMEMMEHVKTYNIFLDFIYHPREKRNKIAQVVNKYHRNYSTGE